jgi:outer membrane protein assembly factor BamB
MKNKNILYILSNGRVAAIDKKDGHIIWEVKIKEYGLSGMSYSVGQISIEDDKLFVGVSGVLLCLNTKDGSLRWKNELKGWGYSFISMANVNNDSNAASMAASNAASATVVASTT